METKTKTDVILNEDDFAKAVKTFVGQYTMDGRGPPVIDPKTVEVLVDGKPISGKVTIFASTHI